MSSAPPTMKLEIKKSAADPDIFTLKMLTETAGGDVQKAQIDVPKTDFVLAPNPAETMLTTAGNSMDFADLGSRLYDLLHREPIKTEWDRFAAANPNCRVVFDFAPPEAASLPWELMFDGTDRMAANPQQTFVRRFQPSRPIAKIESDLLPLRVLIVVGADPTDASVSALDEIRQIKKDIRDNRKLVHRIIDLEIVFRPTLARLQSVYTEFKPHVFHFIGHGGFDFNDRAGLVLDSIDENGDNTRVDWNHDKIFQNLNATGWTPRFAFINACRSNAAPAAADLRQAQSVGDAFRRLNVPAVLTMQADIRGTVAGVFSGALYKSLAELAPLDKALAAARVAVANAVGGFDRRDWATPVLTVAVPPEEVFSLRPTASDQILQEIRDCRAFNEIREFAARLRERRTMMRGFYPLAPDIAERDLIVIHGKEDTGKSWLAKLNLEVCALLNHDVRYVEVGGEKKTWLDVLLHILCGNENETSSYLIYQPLAPTAFEDFKWELKHRLEGRQPPPRDGAKVIVGSSKDGFLIDGQLIATTAHATPNFIAETFDSFQQALVRTAQFNSPLIIVLDHFGNIREEEVTEYLIPLLFRRVSRGDLRETNSAGDARSVKFILIFNDAEFARFRIGNLLSGYQPIDLRTFTEDEFIAYFEELISYKKPDISPDDLKKTVEGTRIWIAGKNELFPDLQLLYTK